VGAFGCFGDQKETLPVTPDQIIHARRAHVLEQAAVTDVSAACRAAGVSRTSYYKWVAKAEKYGLSALMPKDRRAPVMPNAMTAEEVSTILATAVAKATLGARQLVDHVAAAGVHRSASGIQKVLRRHNLSTRRQRIAALASLTAAGTGQLTDAALEGPFGFCLAATDPGQLVCLDTFYVGRLKGVGAVYQLTAIDVATRWLVVRLIVGDKGAAAAARFLDQVQTAFGALDVELAGVLTDNGPEFTGRAFRDHLAQIGVAHHRIPPRSPNHNSVCERVQGTVLQEFYRPYFHRGRVDRITDLDAALQTWTTDYNTRRRNHGHYMSGRSPRQLLDALTTRNALCQTS
jgi:transposase InsO family protein